MSVKATTAPRPSVISSGAETYETRNMEPSRRKNQSRSLVTVSPVVRGRSIGHSAAAKGRPSGWWWWIVSWLLRPSNCPASEYPSATTAARLANRISPDASTTQTGCSTASSAAIRTSGAITCPPFSFRGWDGIRGPGSTMGWVDIEVYAPALRPAEKGDNISGPSEERLNTAARLLRGPRRRRRPGVCASAHVDADHFDGVVAVAEAVPGW